MVTKMKKRIIRQSEEKMMRQFNSKRAQITIFIILAIVIVALIVIFFLVKSGVVPNLTGGGEISPQSFIESCLEDNMRANIHLATLQGGFLDPKLFKMHDDVKATYLCYNRGYFEHCIMQHPMLLSEIEAELKGAIESKVEECYIELENNFQKSGGEMVLGPSTDIQLNLFSGYVGVNLVRDITVTQREETQTFSEVGIRYPSQLFEFAETAMEIAYNEAKYCDFSTAGFMNLFQDYLIIKTKMSDQTEIYTITKKDTQEKMKIAIKGCTLA